MSNCIPRTSWHSKLYYGNPNQIRISKKSFPTISQKAFKPKPCPVGTQRYACWVCSGLNLTSQKRLKHLRVGDIILKFRIETRLQSRLEYRLNYNCSERTPRYKLLEQNHWTRKVDKLQEKFKLQEHYLETKILNLLSYKFLPAIFQK